MSYWSIIIKGATFIAMANLIAALAADTLALLQAELILIMSNDDPTNVAAVVEAAEKELADLPLSPTSQWVKTILPKSAQDWLFAFLATRVAEYVIKQGFLKGGGAPSNSTAPSA